MIHVDFDPDAHPERLTEGQRQWWNAWKARAKAATDSVVDAWEKWRKDSNDETFERIFKSSAVTSVWGELKDWLLSNVFHNKCAYCETPVGRSVFHAEHYRPKGRVSGNEGTVKITDEEGKELEHPGYFWLAFHWKNLLPSCTLCNTVNGKKSQFPIPEQRAYLSMFKGLSRGDRRTLRERIIRSLNWPNIYYLQPDDLDSKEGRLLLHPYFDDPRKCLTFNDFGEVKATGNPEEKARGEWSIKVYNLDHDTLNTERFEAMEAADSFFTTAYRHYRGQEMSVDAARRKAKEDLAGYLEGKKPYSAAVLDFLKLSYPNYF